MKALLLFAVIACAFIIIHTAVIHDEAKSCNNVTAVEEPAIRARREAAKPDSSEEDTKPTTAPRGKRSPGGAGCNNSTVPFPPGALPGNNTGAGNIDARAGPPPPPPQGK